MVSLAKKIKRRLTKQPAYQVKRDHAMKARWETIVDELDGDEKSLIDIGCNIGAFTERAAKLGLLAIGLEPRRREFALAAAKQSQTPGLAFMHIALDPESVVKLPSADVILCLSVNHYWAKLYGEDISWDMIRVLIGKTDKKFFLEIPSIHKKYGERPPHFIEADEASIERYVERKVATITDNRKTVKYLGKMEGIKNRMETFRPMFLIT